MSCVHCGSATTPSRCSGVPAHITVLYPFMPPQQITHEVLARAAAAVASVPAFAFAMGQVGRFPATAYLAPTRPSPSSR